MSIKKHLSGIGIVPQTLLDGYVRYLRLEKSVTENTLDAYLNDLQKLLNYYADEGIDFRRVSPPFYGRRAFRPRLKSGCSPE